MGKWRDRWEQDTKGLPSSEGLIPIPGPGSTEAIHEFLQVEQMRNVPCNSLQECLNLINRGMLKDAFRETDEVAKILESDGFHGMAYLPFTDGGILVYCEDTQTIYGELPDGTELPPIHFNG